jgi:hypothetical protein
LFTESLLSNRFTCHNILRTEWQQTDSQRFYKAVNPEGTDVSGDKWLNGRTYSVEVGNRPMAHNLEEEEEEEEEGN